MNTSKTALAAVAVLSLCSAELVASPQSAESTLPLRLEKGQQLRYQARRRVERSQGKERVLALDLALTYELTVIDTRPDGGWSLELRVPVLELAPGAAGGERLRAGNTPQPGEPMEFKAIRRLTGEAYRVEVRPNGEVAHLDAIDIEKLAPPDDVPRREAPREATAVCVDIAAWVARDVKCILASGAHQAPLVRDAAAFAVDAGISSFVFDRIQRAGERRLSVFAVRSKGLIHNPGVPPAVIALPWREAGTARYDAARGVLNDLELDISEELGSTPGSSPMVARDRVTIRRVVKPNPKG